MTPGPDLPDDAAAPDDELEVRRALMAVLLSHHPTALGANLAIGCTSVVVLALAGVREGLLAWALAQVALVVVRALHGLRLRPRVAQLDTAALRREEHRLVALMAASGTAWGVLPWLSYTGENPLIDLFTVAMLVGMTSGSVNSAAALPRALNLYIVASFLPFIVKSTLIGGLVYGAGALTIVFSALVQMMFGRNAHRALRHTLVVTRQNVRLAEALRRERDAVQAAMRAKDLFLAGVTHDLRQPVHAMALHLRYLRQLRADELDPAGVAALCSPMEAATATMSRQLTRLLALSRLEAGEARVSRRAIALGELAATLRAQFEGQAQAKGLRLRWRLRPDDCAVDSDPQMLQSILDNLLSNAVRYTDRGGVLVAARRRAGRVLFQVVDTGAGIAPEVLPQIFTAYRRFDDRRRDGDEGQGLGLALARKQAELLGHALTVRSVPGCGSVFSLVVPLAGGKGGNGRGTAPGRA